MSQLAASPPFAAAVPVATPALPAADRLTPWQARGLWALAAAFVVFGFFVELRGALLRRPMTDLQVYLRAAWAARTGEDIYAVTDDNGWHYHYPPLLTILIAPLADAPRGADRTGLLPFAVSVALWYGLSLACLAAGVHALASALEPLAAPGSRRWWALRVLPLLACLSPVGATLMRGQVNLMLLALICLAGAATLRGRPWRAGLWIAAAVCLKVIPAFLLVYPLWRRDYRCLAGCALGLLAGLVLIPAAWFGPARTAGYFAEWCEVLVRPALGAGEDHTRDKELIEVTATDSQSLGAIIHNTLHLDRDTRPHQPDAPVRLAHWLGGALMTAVTLLAAGRSPAGHRVRRLLFLGALALVMLMVSPVCHLHYFCLALPLIMGLMVLEWEANGAARLSPGLTLLLALNFLVNFATHLPGTDLLRDLGLAGYATMLLWLLAVVTLCQTRPRPGRQSRLPAAPGAVNVNGVGGSCNDLTTTADHEQAALPV